MVIEISLQDTGEAAYLLVSKEGLAVTEAKPRDPDALIELTSSILRGALRGSLDVFGLAGKSRADESSPVEVKVNENLDEKKARKAVDSVCMILTLFFLPDPLKKRRLQVSRDRRVHGGYALPLLYWDGVRVAYYELGRGMVLNEDKEKDPWPQMFVVLEGKGKVRIGDHVEDLQENTVYYIPSNTVHQIVAEDNTRLIWIAWNAFPR